MQVRPIIATFRSVRDKENILRHASSSKILRQKGIFVTEDFGNKKVNGHSPNRKMFQSSVSMRFLQIHTMYSIQTKYIFKIFDVITSSHTYKLPCEQNKGLERFEEFISEKII